MQDSQESAEAANHLLSTERSSNTSQRHIVSQEKRLHTTQVSSNTQENVALFNALAAIASSLIVSNLLLVANFNNNKKVECQEELSYKEKQKISDVIQENIETSSDLSVTTKSNNNDKIIIISPKKQSLKRSKDKTVVVSQENVFVNQLSSEETSNKNKKIKYSFVEDLPTESHLSDSQCSVETKSSIALSKKKLRTYGDVSTPAKANSIKYNTASEGNSVTSENLVDTAESSNNKQNSTVTKEKQLLITEENKTHNIFQKDFSTTSNLLHITQSNSPSNTVFQGQQLPTRKEKLTSNTVLQEEINIFDTPDRQISQIDTVLQTNKPTVGDPTSGNSYNRSIVQTFRFSPKSPRNQTNISLQDSSSTFIRKPYSDNLIALRADTLSFHPFITDDSVNLQNYDSQPRNQSSKNLNNQPSNQPNKQSSNRPDNQTNKLIIATISQQISLQLLLSDKDTKRVLPTKQISAKTVKRKEEKSLQNLIKLSIDSFTYNFDEMVKRVKIAIVGAGASGIAAASKLLREGINDFVVLEANDRIGGRINTVEFGDNVVDLGAQWVHGEIGNVVHELASKHDLLSSFCTFFDASKHEFFTINGEKIPERESFEALTIYYNMMKEAPDELSNAEGSFGDYFREKFYKIYSENPFTNEHRVSQLLSWMEKAECSIECSDSLSEVSAKRLADYWECKGDSVQNWKDRGYKTLFDLLMRKIPNAENSLSVMEKVEFKKTVTTIDYSSEEDVLVTTSDGCNYIASHVIFTASLGVLKKKHSTLFVPPLPLIKKRAITGLSIGTANKIFMEFPYKWWSENTVAINLVCLEENKTLFVKKYGEKYRWLCDVFSFYVVDYQPRLLCAWIVGKYARHMETLSDSDVSDGLYRLLQESIGKYYDVVQPTRILRSKWFTNEYFQGSYTFQSMNTENMDVKPNDLAEPIIVNGKPVILFAGEATHDHYYSTVHGAVETGFREADRLLDFNQRETRDCLDQLVHNIRNMALDESSSSDGQTTDSDEQTDDYDERIKIVIVGGGIAGMAAAATLHEAGWDFVILEAQDRLGGRIHSVKVEDGWIELGAQYLHGDSSKLAKYCRDKDLLSRIYGTDGEGLYLRDNGCSISSGTGLACDVNDAIHDALHSSEQFYKNNEAEFYIDNGESVGAYMRKIFDRYLSECNDPPPIRRMKEEIYDFKMRYLQVDNSCDSMYDLSVKMWGKYEIAGRDKYQMFKEGYVSLLNTLSKDIPSNKFRLNCPVESIHWRNCIRTSNDSAILVKTRDNKRILCDAVIVTCSLGVLKSCHEKMFVPPLPPPLKLAIEDLGFGVVNKIILRYNKPWWHTIVTGFQILPTHDRPDMPPLPQWTAHITGFDVLPNHKCILVGWVSGVGARAIEDIPEVTIGLHVTSLLSRYMNRPIPPPAECFRSKWFTNEFIRGGYSNIPTTCENTDVSTSTLAEPIWAKIKNNPTRQVPILLLAGEATHDRYFSTVHGAYETGVHQASLCLLHHTNSV